MRKPDDVPQGEWDRTEADFANQILPGAPQRLWFEIGRTLWAVQTAEGTLLTIVFLLNIRAEMTVKEREEVFQKYRSRTAAQLADLIRKTRPMEDALKQKVDI